MIQNYLERLQTFYKEIKWAQIMISEYLIAIPSFMWQYNVVVFGELSQSDIAITINI